MEGASTSRCVSCVKATFRPGPRGRRPTVRKSRRDSELRRREDARWKDRGRAFRAELDFG
jgi:hypothetical protein